MTVISNRSITIASSYAGGHSGDNVRIQASPTMQEIPDWCRKDPTFIAAVACGAILEVERLSPPPQVRNQEPQGRIIPSLPPVKMEETGLGLEPDVVVAGQQSRVDQPRPVAAAVAQAPAPAPRQAAPTGDKVLDNPEALEGQLWPNLPPSPKAPPKAK